MTAPQTPPDARDTPRDPERLDAAPPPRPRARDRLREKLPELLLEAGSVVLAVLLALAVDEWRENRARHALAVRAQESILREVRANLAELGEIREANQANLEKVEAQIKALDGKTPVNQVNVDIRLAQLSSAAWQTAQSTEALQFVEFTWLVNVAGTYEAQKLVQQTQTEILSRIGDVAAADTQAQRLTHMRQIGTRMSLLMMLSRQLTDAYNEVVTSAPPAP